MGTKVVCWDHFNYKSFRNHKRYNELRNLILNGKIDRFVVLTKSDAASYLEYERDFPKDLIWQIYNPSPIQTVSYAPRPNKKVLALGRLHNNQKGFDLLLEAWRIVENQDTKWQLEIVGDGGSRRDLEKQIMDLRLQRVTISHFTDNVRGKYAEAGIFVLSSRFEGLGLVLLEAESMSLPLVSFECPCGPKEIIRDGYNGYLAEPENPIDLAEKLLAVMNDNTLREHMGRNAFESSRQFSTNKIIDQWEDLLNSLQS